MSTMIRLVTLFVTMVFFMIIPTVRRVSACRVSLARDILSSNNDKRTNNNKNGETSLFPGPLSTSRMTTEAGTIMTGIRPSATASVPSTMSITTGTDRGGNGASNSGSTINNANPKSNNKSNNNRNANRNANINSNENRNANANSNANRNSNRNANGTTFGMRNFCTTMSDRGRVPCTTVGHGVGMSIAVGMVTGLSAGNGLVSMCPADNKSRVFMRTTLSTIQQTAPCPGRAKSVRPMRIPMRFMMRTSNRSRRRWVCLDGGKSGCRVCCFVFFPCKGCWGYDKDGNFHCT